MTTPDMVQRCHALETRLRGEFLALLASKRKDELKELARQVRANTRGCTVRSDWEHVIEQRWRSEVWDIAGYQYGVRPMHMFYPQLLQLPPGVKEQ